MNPKLWCSVGALTLLSSGAWGQTGTARKVPVPPAVQNEKLVHGPAPAYPAAAKAARLSGAVRMLAIIGTDGSVKSLQVLNGHPILAQAAVTAVSAWRYEPTVRDGTPVEVITQIGVQFSGDGTAAPNAPRPPVRAQHPFPSRPPAAGVGRVEVEPEVQARKLLKAEPAGYPPRAREAGVAGLVRFAALIGTDGTVKETAVLRGHPLLNGAAEAALLQYRYEAGPAEAVTQVDVPVPHDWKSPDAARR